MDENILDSDLSQYGNEPKVRWAGFWIRFGASILDSLILIIPTIVLYTNMLIIKSFPIQIVLFLIMAAYKPFMEFKYGATLGKMAVKIKVVNKLFEPISGSQAMVRYFPWAISQLFSLYTYWLMFNSESFGIVRGFFDLAKLQNDINSAGFSYFGALIFIVSGLFVVLNQNKQALHDMAANTYCIYTTK